MASLQDSPRRAGRLRKLFQDTISGNRPVRNPQDAQLFLEAVRGQDLASRCVEILVGKPSGLDAVRDAIRSDLSLPFILSHTLPFLRYLADPGVKALVDGRLLEQMLVVVANPPTVLNKLIDLYNARQIPDDGLNAFAWLALELISLDSSVNIDVTDLVRAVTASQQFLQSKDHSTRELGYKIQKVLQIRCSTQNDDEPCGAGGRHDNDFSNFRKISIYPTTDEFLSTQTPYYRTAREVAETNVEKRAGVHLDNQFRLLREDMLAELREDLQVAMGEKKGKRTSLALGHLVPSGIDIGDESTGRYKKCTLLLRCYSGLNFLTDKEPSVRKKYLQDHANFLKHQSFGVLCRGKEIFGFASVDRDLDKLARSPPVLSLQFTDAVGLKKALLALGTVPRSDGVQFILVDTPVFAYEPVLRELQRMTDVPLLDLLVNPAGLSTNSSSDVTLPSTLRSFTTNLKAQLDQSRLSRDPEAVVRLWALSGPEIKLDKSQLEALHVLLTSPVSLVQGPPGTGKSFIGAQAVRFFVHAGLRLLVLSYTNHALCQFLEDLLKAGISSSSIVRIGAKSKCTPVTAALLLSEQKRQYRRSREAWEVIGNYKRVASTSGAKLQQTLQKILNSSISWVDIEEYLEFSEDGQGFLEALRVPTDSTNTGWTQTGNKGKKVGPDYLYKQWIKGKGPGVFAKGLPEGAKAVWEMAGPLRLQHHQKWLNALMEEDLQHIQDLASQFNDVQSKIGAQFDEADAYTMAQKRVIGCTTTGAAKYAHLIRAAKPDVVLVEEAGEILESHVLTALPPTVKQICLIGDHKQLRPKINNYALSVEKGDGFDLNCSLFERLIKHGARHVTLGKQHRMAPEISVFARELTYPDLLDGPETSGRPLIDGLRDRVVFLNHGRQEESDAQLRDRRDPSVKESKRNLFEAEMVLCCVKYLGQQGYSSDRIVVLVPYLGQLRVLQDLFRKNNHDPTISEMDKAELIRAGLISEAAAKLDKKPLRISTIDNYQGEESDIVIASLTRSNESGDIGFMSAPERLNVLITRARNCLILIGNMDTFMRSKKGKATWHPFFDILKRKGHIYDGLPVKCHKHPDRTASLREPLDFYKSCPDGGCTEPCDAPLRCGIHKCTSRCHRVDDHSRTECNQLVEKVCDRQHKTKTRCSRQKDGCQKCIQEDREMERQIKRNLQLEEDRHRREKEYTRQLREIQDELEHQRRINKYHAEEQLRKQTLEQHRSDLAALKNTELKLKQQNQLKAQMECKIAERLETKANRDAEPGASKSSSVQPDCLSGAQAEWNFMKENEGAQSKPLDELMEMVGLEDVKQAFISVKSRIDTALRQGITVASERFSCSMLGNPGTGKTTVARLYAQFLTDLCVIPGSRFEETTGAALANLGVAGCTKRIDNILEAGGGVLFIDEAYQLTSGNNPGGGAVLDHLLAEVENLRGKVVFVLAGYNKQMESFFAHNPGLPSRFPIEMSFADYSDEELLSILELKINKKYNGMMNCEDGLKGLYCRIVARRIGRARGKEGFGNARAVENALDIISRRQGDRLRKARKGGATPDDFIFTKEDLIGPEPGDALARCPAWKKLQDLVGLGAVKQAVQSLVESIQQNYLRELAEEPPIQYSLNKVFLGNPGTGKTTVAKLYGAILVSLGLLSKGEVVMKNPSDFVGGHLGQSEQLTKGILAATVGKVLVIDEAYGLYGGGGTTDPYKTAVIDTIVADVQSVPGDDRCVLLLGYKDQMEDMFRNVNPGLQRRFPMASAFNFEDFSDEDLRKILDLKLEQQGYQVTDQAAKVAMEMLKRARNRPNFGNAGEIDILLDAAKARHQIRFSKKAAKSAAVLEAKDFDEDFDRAERTETNVRRLFDGTVGCEETIALLESYQDTVRTLRALDMDPKENIPFNFLFRGPPGTGKTTTARKIGKVFYDMGFLATAEVVECSATDLIGQYVGQTGPKVQQALDKALGKVLFVDEAYRLAEGHFAKEAMDEIVDSVTKERYFKKLIIILAGYEADINRLMSVNSGLTSRFPAVINFRALVPEECLSLMVKLLQKQQDSMKSKGKELDLSCLEGPTTHFKRSVLDSFTDLAAQDNWASARDVQELAKGIFNRLLRTNKEGLSKGRIVLSETDVTQELKDMLKERASRSDTKANPTTVFPQRLRDVFHPRLASPVLTAQPPSPTIPTATCTPHMQSHPPPTTADEERKPQHAVKKTEQKDEQDYPRPVDRNNPLRDPSVSDAVWHQLQLDRQAEQRREEDYRQLQEEARKAATEAAREEIVKRLLGEEARRRREEEAKRKLQEMGRCPMGYAWIRQEAAGGWRCAGGSHWVGDGELGP